MEKSKNNLKQITQIALNLLDLPIRKNDIDKFGFVHHPFFNNNFIVFKDELVDISKGKNKFNEYIKELKEHISNEKNVYSLVALINKPYRILFLHLIEKYLNDETFANLLKECYTDTEFPNHDVNVSVEKIKNMFEKANKNLLMDANEFKIFNKLEDEITIYRGFYSEKYYDALSWTLDIDKAHFFARRFNNTKGSIYQANIKKENIYAYFDCRNEKEIIVDYSKLYNVSKKEQFN